MDQTWSLKVLIPSPIPSPHQVVSREDRWISPGDLGRQQQTDGAQTVARGVHHPHSLLETALQNLRDANETNIAVHNMYIYINMYMYMYDGCMNIYLSIYLYIHIIIYI